MNKTYFKNKKATVMGLGLHGGGLGVAKWLVKAGAKVTVTDLKTKVELKKSLDQLKGLKIKFVLGEHRAVDFKNADIVIQNPGVPHESKFLQMARESGAEIMTDISIFFALCPAAIIGITGTKGKSTTTALVGEIFKFWKKDTVVGGNIRKSPLDFLAKLKNNTPVILELSSWQLEGLPLVKKSPHVSLITNLHIDHLNRYKNFSAYAEAKKLIYAFQTPDDFIVLNYDNEGTREIGKEVFSRRYWFSKKYFAEENGSFISGGRKQGTENRWIVFRRDGKETAILKLSDIKLIGEHNLENVLAAVTLAMISDVPVFHIRKAVKNFTGLWGRMELVREFKDVKFINDTTATAPEAAVNALITLRQETRDKRQISQSQAEKNIILIAGGADKNLDFKEMAKEIKKSCKKIILVRGDASNKLLRELRKIKYASAKIQARVSSMKEAVAKVYELSQKGDIVLLSPGAASFGLFVNEFDRGEQFVREVKKLK